MFFELEEFFVWILLTLLMSTAVRNYLYRRVNMHYYIKWWWWCYQSRQKSSTPDFTICYSPQRTHGHGRARKVSFKKRDCNREKTHTISKTVQTFRYFKSVYLAVSTLSTVIAKIIWIIIRHCIALISRLLKPRVDMMESTTLHVGLKTL